MEVQAANLLATLRRPAAASEQKLTMLSNLKSDIKHYRVPENAQATIFDCLKLAITQQSSINIVTAALSTLGHLVKRLKIQDPEGRAISSMAPRLWPCLLEKLGDPRESHRAAASQALIDLHPFCATDVEHMIREDVIGGSNPRAKEVGMQWVVQMHEEQNLPFKSFVPAIVLCLEEADGMVRDAAKAALVDLFRGSSTAATNDLKRQLKLHSIRTSIVTQVLSQLGTSDRPERPAPATDLAASTRSLPAFDHAALLAESTNGEESRPPVPEEVPLDPIFVHTQRELEDMFRDMAPHFEGRESEENWMLRDKDVTKLRRLTKGNAPSEFHSAYMSGIKQLQDGTLKVANSLRTTMMTNGCQFVQELARNLGPAMDSMVESYLQSFIKMCAATKHLQTQGGNTTVETIIQYVSYNVRISQHIWSAAQDKNKQPRIFASGWLRTLLNRQAGSRAHFEHSGGLELAEKTIKKGLTDADPKVKENMRAAYWAFARLWPDRAEAIMAGLDDKAKVALERDSHNPNATGAHASFSASTNSRASGARSALRDRIAAAKRASQGQPPRPMTAMASMSPAKSKSMANLNARAKAMGPPTMTRNVSTASTASVATVDTVVSNPSSSGARPNSLMSGAARRPVKRPEPARPTTADPYSARKIIRPETPSGSNKSPTRSPGSSTINRPTRSTLAKSRASALGSPATSPVRSPHTVRSGQTMDSQDTTNFMPGAQLSSRTASTRIPQPGSPQSLESGIHGLGIDDNFTLVLPSALSSGAQAGHGNGSNAPSPRAYGSQDTRSNVPEEQPNSLRTGASPSLRKSKSPAPARTSSPRAITPDRQDTPQHEPPRTQPRQGSPLKTFSASADPEQEVKIYEDPFVSNGSNPVPILEPPTVLAELPVNNHSPPTNSDPLSSLAPERLSKQTNGTEQPPSPPLSPQSKAEKMRSRKLLQSGIQRIRARTLDTHGYRKVVELTRTIDSNDLFGHVLEDDDEQVPRAYNDLLNALCGFVSTAPGTTPTPDRPGQRTTSTSEVKRQAFALLRSLLRSGNAQFQVWNRAGAWHTKSLTASLHGRKHVDGTGMVVKDIESLIAEILASTARGEIVRTLLDFLNGDDDVATAQSSTTIISSDDGGDARQKDSNAAKNSAQAIALALRTLTSSLASPPSSIAEVDSPASLATREVSRVVAAGLANKDAEVRKAAVECATELYVAWPCSSDEAEAQQDVGGGAVDGDKVGYWAALEEGGELNEGMKNLIVYFIARREERGRTGGGGGGGSAAAAGAESA